MPAPQYPVILTKKKQLSDNTVQLDFELEGGSGTDFDYVAGQFIQFLIETKEKVKKRSYSIAGSPTEFKEQKKLSVALSYVENGLASSLFSSAEPGLKMDISGPYGVLTLPGEISGQLVLVGTGTGIAPYRSMLPQLKELADKGTSVNVVMGVRHHNDLIYRNDFEAIERLNYRVCYSRETEVNQEKNEFTGYVQDQFSNLNLNPETDLVYLCGNPGMIDSAASVLKEMGFPPRQVKREKYVYSGH